MLTKIRNKLAKWIAPGHYLSAEEMKIEGLIDFDKRILSGVHILNSVTIVSQGEGQTAEVIGNTFYNTPTFKAETVVDSRGQ